MKLLTVLVLAALPLYCSAGSGCSFLEEGVSKTINPEVSISEYQHFLEKFASNPEDQEALADIKQCFLSQSNETLTNFEEMMQSMYSSKYCLIY